MVEDVVETNDGQMGVRITTLYPRTSMDIHGYAWISMDIRSQLIFINVHRHMDIHGYSWRSKTVICIIWDDPHSVASQNSKLANCI